MIKKGRTRMERPQEMMLMVLLVSKLVNCIMQKREMME